MITKDSLALKPRFKKSLVNRLFVRECPGYFIASIIEERRWHNFAKHPELTVAPIVREFYANAKKHTNKKAFVRGKCVHFDNHTINRFYGLGGFEDDEYSEYRKNPNPNKVIKRLTNNRVAWKLSPTNEVVNFPSSSLGYEAKAWHYFIFATLLPSGNTSDVTKRRAILNYVIFKGFTIDVGKIIERSILATLEGKRIAGLGHPSLIYQLCLQKGVEASDREEVLHPLSEL